MGLPVLWPLPLTPRLEQFLLFLSPLLSQAALILRNDLKLIQSKVMNGGQPPITLSRDFFFLPFNKDQSLKLKKKKNPCLLLARDDTLFLRLQGLPRACGVTRGGSLSGVQHHSRCSGLDGEGIHGSAPSLSQPCGPCAGISCAILTA